MPAYLAYVKMSQMEGAELSVNLPRHVDVQAWGGTRWNCIHLSPDGLVDLAFEEA